jgi:hypothetical protein
MANGHLVKATSGHLKKKASGHLSNVASADIVFTLETGQYVQETNLLLVYDPAGYGYSAADTSSYPPINYFPFPGASMPLTNGRVYNYQYPANPVSGNGGFASYYGSNPATPGFPIRWTGSSPSGVFKFWVERTNGATMSALGFRYRIYVAGALFWERTGTGSAAYSSSRRYTQLWTYDSNTGIVS